MSAFRSKADIDQPLPTNLDYEYTPLAPRRGPPPRGRHGGRPGATGSGAIRVESVPADGDDRTLRARARVKEYTRGTSQGGFKPTPPNKTTRSRLLSPSPAATTSKC
jgi:hypothetical protein